MLKECPNCGSTGIGVREMFCPNCGEALFSQTRGEPPRGGDAGPAVTGPDQSYVMPYGANTDAPQAGGYAPPPGQALTPLRATASYSYQKKRKRAHRIFTVVGIILIAGVVLGLSYILYVSYFKSTRMELAQPSGWKTAPESARKDFEGSLDPNHKVTIEFLYISPDGNQFLIGYHRSPDPNDMEYGLPDTKDLATMERYISEYQPKYTADGGKPAVTIKGLPLDCGNVALVLSGIANDSQVVQMFLKKGTTQFEIYVLDSSTGNISDSVQYVVDNLKFK